MSVLTTVVCSLHRTAHPRYGVAAAFALATKKLIRSSSSRSARNLDLHAVYPAQKRPHTGLRRYIPLLARRLQRRHWLASRCAVQA